MKKNKLKEAIINILNLVVEELEDKPLKPLEAPKDDFDIKKGGLITTEQMLKMNEVIGYSNLKGTPIPSEFKRGYNAFSGVDVKVFFEDEKGKEVIGTMQGFSYQKEIKDGMVELRGSATFITFDKQDNWLGKKVRMLAVAANEYGAISVIFDENIYFDTLGYGVSVDDIVSEEHYLFKGTDSETIEEHNKRLEGQMEKYIEKYKEEERQAFLKVNKPDANI